MFLIHYVLWKLRKNPWEVTKGGTIFYKSCWPYIIHNVLYHRYFSAHFPEFSDSVLEHLVVSCFWSKSKKGNLKFHKQKITLCMSNIQSRKYSETNLLIDLHVDVSAKKKLKCSSLCDFAKKHERGSKHVLVHISGFNVQKFCVMQLLNEPFNFLQEMETSFSSLTFVLTFRPRAFQKVVLK